MHWKKKESVLSADGRFVFDHMPLTDYTFILQNSDGTKVNTLNWRLKRDRKIEGIRFERKDGELNVFAGKGIRTVELYLAVSAHSVIIRTDNWAAIDKKQNVFSPEGKRSWIRMQEMKLQEALSRWHRMYRVKGSR